jgi:penicillin-binding protein 1A
MNDPYEYKRRSWPPEPKYTVLEPERRPKAAFFLTLLVCATLFFWLSWQLPVSRALEPLKQPAILYLSADGEPIVRRGFYKAEPVDADSLPDHVENAVIAIEDRRFRRHFGVDPKGIARAFVRNSREGRVVQGGSTITQQLAKNSFLGPERSYRRKAQEALIALWLEVRLGKDEILSRYLSSVYFGEGAYGLRAAARQYFGKEPERLTLGESAILAGLIKAPSAINPRKDLEASHARAREVLAAMVEAGFLTEAEAKRVELPKPVARDRAPVGSYFVDWLEDADRFAVQARYGEATVETTLDSRLQAAAERAVRAELAAYARRGVGQAALVAMRCDGSVVAMVGGRDYKQSQFNRAVQARRQPGSAFKPFVYLAAARSGRGPDSLISDQPLKIGNWTPKNHEGGSQGVTTLRRAFAASSNTAAVQLSETVGRARVIQAAQDLGIRTPLQPHPSLALGASEVTLLDLTRAYAAFRTGVYPVEPWGLPDQPRGGARRALDVQREQKPMLALLNAVVAEGTGRAAALPDVAAFGKTGTSQNYVDAWFVGFAGDLVVGVWVGNDDRTPMRGVTGGTAPAAIWKRFMQGAQRARLFDTGACPPLPPPDPPRTDPFPSVWDEPGLFPVDDLPPIEDYVPAEEYAATVYGPESFEDGPPPPLDEGLPPPPPLVVTVPADDRGPEREALRRAEERFREDRQRAAERRREASERARERNEDEDEDEDDD